MRQSQNNVVESTTYNLEETYFIEQNDSKLFILLIFGPSHQDLLRYKQSEGFPVSLTVPCIFYAILFPIKL